MNKLLLMIAACTPVVAFCAQPPHDDATCLKLLTQSRSGESEVLANAMTRAIRRCREQMREREREGQAEVRKIMDEAKKG